MNESVEGVVQNYGEVCDVPLGLSKQTRIHSVQLLNRMLAHAMAVRDLYKKAHWQVSGANFYALHLLYDKHYREQLELIDALAERVQALGGVALALAHDIAAETPIARGPRDRQTPYAQLVGLRDAHELVLTEARDLASAMGKQGDSGSEDLLVGQCVRLNESQSWFVTQHIESIA